MITRNPSVCRLQVITAMKSVVRILRTTPDPTPCRSRCTSKNPSPPTDLAHSPRFPMADLQIERRAKLLAIPFSSLLLFLLLLNSPAPKSARNVAHRNFDIHATSHIQTTTTYRIASGHCADTPYPDLCVSTLTTIPQLTTKSLPQIIIATINHTAPMVESSGAACASFLRSRLASYDARQRAALSDCLDLFDQTMSDFHEATACLEKHPTSSLDKLKTVLSAAITNQYSCLDGFAYVNDSRSLRPRIEGELFNISHLVSNSLALAKKIHPQNGIR